MERRNVTGRINKFTTNMLIAGFAILFAADLIFMAYGFRAAIFLLFVLMAAAWGLFHLVTGIMPQVALEESVLEPPSRIPEELFSNFSHAALVDAPGQGAGWLNTLRNWIGPVARLDPESLQGLGGKLLAVLPEQSAHLLMNESLLKKLDQAAQSGAAVIIDNPTPQAARALGVELADETVSGLVTWVDSNALGDYPAQQIADSPLELSVQRVSLMPSGFADWMRCAEYPAVITQPRGRGVFIITLFPWAETLTTLRQGRDPAPSSTAAYHPWHRVSPRMRGNELPIADLLDVFMLGLVRRYAPVCGWWRHPDAAPGTFVITASDDCAGARTSVVLETAGKSSCSPTVFLMPGQGTNKAMDPAGWRPGLLWNRFPLHTWRGRVRRNPFCNISDQIKALDCAQDVPPVRIHQQRLDGGLDHVFGALQNAGVCADATFGPGPGQQGYLFATGFPFHPQSTQGGAFTILETPYQVHDRSGAPSMEWEEALMDRMSDPPHSPLSISLHPFHLLQNRHVRETAARMVNSARDSGCALPDIASWVRFWNHRAASTVSSAMGQDVLKVEVNAQAAGMAVDVPDRIRGRARIAVSLDGQPVANETIKGNAVPVPQGAHVIEISYEK